EASSGGRGGLDRVYWMPPLTLFSPPEGGGKHRQNGGKPTARTPPAEKIDRLKRLLEEIQRVAAIGEISIGDRSQRGGREPLRGGARRDRGAQGPLRACPMTHPHPMAEPTRERCERN